jgi:Na+-driven multidrug efflux pump
MNSIALSAQAFISQNYGARNYPRIKRTFFTSIGIVSVVGVVVSGVMVALVYPLIKVISGDAMVAQAAFNKTLWIGAFYTLCGIMDTMSYSLRGVGKSLTGMFVTLTGTVLFRVLWIIFIFPINQTEAMLYCVYPITWVITIVTFIIILSRVFKNLRRRFALSEKIANDFKQERESKLQSNKEQAV